MKRAIVLVLALLCITSLTSFAQTSTTANITANVTAVLTITNTAALNIGTVNQGQTVTLTSLQAGAAAFTVNGQASASTTVAVTGPPGGNLVSGASTIPFTLQTGRYNTVNTQSSSTAFPGTSGGTATTSATGALYLWIGGGVTASALQPAGSYTGTLTVSVTQP